MDMVDRAEEKHGTCLGGRAKALRQARWLMGGSEADEGRRG